MSWSPGAERTVPAGAASAVSSPGASDHAALPPPSAPRRQLGDGAVVALLAATVVGAWWHPSVSLATALAALGVAGGLRSPWLAVMGAGLLAASLAGRSLEGLEGAARAPITATATLVSDPVRSPYGVSADVRFGGHRWLLRASEHGAGALERSLAGERVQVEGRTRPPPEGAGWMVPRHLVGMLDADRVERVDAGGAAARAANRLRRAIEDSLGGWTRTDRSLVMGFVLGDGRDQGPATVADFRGSGLSHLLVVSGQNVAFVLALCRPLTERLGLGGRATLTFLVLGAFGAVTRFEPSVLRAIAMAAVAVTGRTVGRPSPPWRVLALAVSALVLVDPLLVRSVGFRLSVAATAGVALLGPPIAARLRGPRALADAVGTSIAAQIGVAPVLLPVSGGLPVVALPANVIAGPAAALVTTWGLPAGLLGGWIGDGRIRWIHLPTIAGARWVAGVARVAAASPLGDLQAPHVIVLTVCVALLLRARRPLLQGAAALAGVLCLVAPALALRHPPTVVELPSGAVITRAREATVIDAYDASPSVDLLDDLRRAGVRQVDVLVVRSSGGGALVALVGHRWSVRSVVDERSPPLRRVVGGVEVSTGMGARPVVAPIG